MSASPQQLVEEVSSSSTSSIESAPSRLKSRLLNLFAPAQAPYNLAIFRIFLFASFLFAPELYLSPKYAALPTRLMNQDPGIHWLVSCLPVNEATAQLVLPLLIISCVAASIGLFTRFSTVVAVLLGTYAFGLRELCGQVNHTNNHLIYFAAILALSPCADALSVDSFLKKRGKGNSEEPFNSRMYSLPLRLCWLMLGTIYFFPGIWKLNLVGLKFAFSDNFARLIYKAECQSGGHWHPLFPIYNYPLVCQLGALSVMLFEIGFVFLVFVPVLRVLMAAAGMMFHTMTVFFLNIRFIILQFSYVALIDWHRLCQRYGKRFLPAALTQPVTRTVPAKLHQLAPMLIVGLSMFAVNCYFGVNRIHSGWPFACYPIFCAIPADTMMMMNVEATDKNGNLLNVRPAQHMLSERQIPTPPRSHHTAAGKANQVRWFQTLWDKYVAADPSLAGATTVRLYEDTLNILPEHRKDNPIKRNLLVELKPQ